MQTSPASNNSPYYEHVKVLSQGAKRANGNTVAVQINKAQFSHLSYAFHTQERFNWGSDGEQVSTLTCGMVVFSSFYFIYLFLCSFWSQFVLPAVDICHLEADSPYLLIIFVTDFQQLLKIEASPQYHQPQIKRATAGSHNRFS
jgi:hypothetical protein